MPTSLSEDNPFRAGVLPETQVLLAGQDLLTGLSSRAGLEAHFRLAAARARRSGARFAVGVVDLVVDPAVAPDEVFGHDLLVVEAARRLRACLRETDLIARVAETRFAFIAEEVTPEGLTAIAKRAAEAISPAGAAQPDRAAPRVGLVLWQHDERTLPALLRAAEEALAAAPEPELALPAAANAESFGAAAPVADALPPAASLPRRVARRALGWLSLAALVALALAGAPAEWRAAWQPLEALAGEGLRAVRSHLPSAPPADRP
jgi:diguanylate cyclase (GGDEF)-like protein